MTLNIKIPLLVILFMVLTTILVLNNHPGWAIMMVVLNLIYTTGVRG